MTEEGHVVLFRFPQTDHKNGKLRPALILRKLPGKFQDWLICMISSQLHQEIRGLDEVVTPVHSDFMESGLKLPSVIRVSRLAVVEESVFLGKLGEIDNMRLCSIKKKLAEWINEI